MGSPDPRLDWHGNIDIRLARLIRHYTKVDPPPERIPAIPMRVLRHALHFVFSDPTASVGLRAVADLIIIAYYFLMRPGEYCTSQGEEASHPFHSDEVQLWRGQRLLSLLTASDDELLAASFCILTFTEQKNAKRGEKVGQGLSGDPIFCPTRALARRLIHLRRNGAPPHTPIHTYYEQYRGTPKRVHSSAVTSLLRRSAAMLPEDFNPALISVRGLRPSGAMSLMAARIDSCFVRMMGRWNSDSMFEYLQVQAAPIVNNFARAMCTRGNYDFMPTSNYPMYRDVP